MQICPECNSADVEEIDEFDEGEGRGWGVGMLCKKCGCEWDERSSLNITKHGKGDEE